MATLFASLFPNVMVSSLDAAYNLTVENTASGNYALTIMTWVAVIMFPVVLIYQAWNYWSPPARRYPPAQETPSRNRRQPRRRPDVPHRPRGDQRRNPPRVSSAAAYRSQGGVRPA